MACSTRIARHRGGQQGAVREEVFTDRKAGTIRRLLPVTAVGEAGQLAAGAVFGQTQLLTPGGVLPLSFEIEAGTLAEAAERFPAACTSHSRQAIEEARSTGARRRRASSCRM